MFFHNFKYSFKILLKNKVLVFWSILWPLILGTLFYMAFSNMSSAEQLDTINLGVVNNKEYKNNIYLSSTLKELSDSKNDDQLFEIKYDDKESLNKMLEDKKIDGYIYVDNKTNIVVKESNINQTIIKNVVDQIEEYKNVTMSLTTYEVENNIKKGKSFNQNEISQNILTKLSENKVYLEDNSNKNMDYMMIEYYTLLAMACLYGALLSCEVTKNYLGNINKKGSRITLSKAKRTSLLLSGLLSSFIVQLVTIGSLLLYTKFVLSVDYGNKMLLVILLSVIGSLAGLALGVFMGSVPFKSDNTRTGVTNVVVMLGCFFAGMMGVTMKYVIDSNIPIINKLNPANMITDGFYSLYYYSDLSRFYFNIISLLLLTVILIAGACCFLRRKKYDSI